MSYNDFPLTLTRRTVGDAQHVIGVLLEHFEATADGDSGDAAAAYADHISDTAREVIAALDAALEANRTGIRRAHEIERAEWHSQALTRASAKPAPPGSTVPAAEAWLLDMVLRGDGIGANQYAIEPAGPVRKLAEQMARQGLLIQGEPIPDSLTGLVYFHATEAGAAAIGLDFVPAGSERPKTKKLVQRRRKKAV